MRTLTHPNAKAICLSIEDHETLTRAEEILRDIQFAFGGQTTIMSLETGEVISPDELPRARAILDFLNTYRMVEIDPK